MKSKWILVIFVAILFLLSALLVAYIYLILPIEDVINRQLLFGISFQIWGIITTVLVVRKIFNMRDNQRWQAVNSYVYNFLYWQLWASISEMFSVFKIVLDVKEKPTIIKVGKAYMNPEYDREWRNKVLLELKKIEKEGVLPIKKNMLDWQPSTHKEFSRIMEDLKSHINEELSSYPHHIPPEFLSKIVKIRDTAYGLTNQSLFLSEKDQVEKLGINYQKHHDSMMDIESGQVFVLFGDLLKLLDILDKNVGDEWK